MGRAERRKAERQERQYRVRNDAVIRRNEDRDARVNARIAAIEKNGITVKELEENYNIGYKAGRKSGVDDTGKTMFSAICLALHEECGFGAQKIFNIIRSVADHVVYALTSEDLIDEVMEKVGIEINLDDPLEPVKIHKQKSVKWKEVRALDKVPFDEMVDDGQ